MSDQKLMEQIKELITAYNKALEYDSDDRVIAAELHLARPPQPDVDNKPSSVFVVPDEFGGPETDPKGAAADLTLEATPRSVVSTAGFANTGYFCCRPGKMGYATSSGKIIACFAHPACNAYAGPIYCP